MARDQIWDYTTGLLVSDILRADIPDSPDPLKILKNRVAVLEGDVDTLKKKP
jgi:hypothetical protein